jgi:hypothetical protein
MSPLGFLNQVGNSIDLETATQAQIDEAFNKVLEDPVKWR